MKWKKLAILDMRERTAHLPQSCCVCYRWKMLGNERFMGEPLRHVGRARTLLSSDPEERWTIGLAMGKVAVASDKSTEALFFPALYCMSWPTLYF